MMNHSSGSRSVQASEAGIEAIEAERIKRKWTRQALADQAGIHLDTLKRLLRNVRIDRESVRKIAEALELQPTAIVQPDEWSLSKLPRNKPTSKIEPESSIKVLICSHWSNSQSTFIQLLSTHLSTTQHTTRIIQDIENVELLYLNEGLEWCDYLVLLLSPQAAVSEMMTETIQRVRSLRSLRCDRRPHVLPIYWETSDLLNYDQRSYLQGLQSWEWRSPDDTPSLIQSIVRMLQTNPSPLYKPEIEFPIPPLNQEKIETLPLPSAEPELPEGQVELASAFYIERPPIESRCYATISKGGALIRIKAPRQMGKTSLMERILYHASQRSHLTVPLNFQLADGGIFSNLDKFLQWFCMSITWHLGLADRLSDHWNPLLGSKMSCTSYFEKYLLNEIDGALTLGLDEVDLVFQHPEIASDFLGLLRAWHEAAKNREIWRKLRLVVVHSTEVYVPLNINQSPFNVGLAIELPEFTPEQVHDLAQRYRLQWDFSQVKRLMDMVGGHPFLIRLALYHLAQHDLTLDKLLQTAPMEAGIYNDHLRRHWWILEQHPDLAIALHKVISANQPIRLETYSAFKLHSMGLVRWENNEIMLRCQLYQQYFGDRLHQP
jgi:transcriptional regulator with XRE-family HTH domain